MKIQPSRGRYFPIGIGRVAALTKGWHLGDWPASRPISFENPGAVFHDRRPLARLRQRQSITIYSLPETMDRALAENATVRAIELCAPYNRAEARDEGHVNRSLIVYLEELATLRLVERRVYYRPTKYRAADKFSTAAKPRILRIEEHDVERVSLA